MNCQPHHNEENTHYYKKPHVLNPPNHKVVLDGFCENEPRGTILLAHLPFMRAITSALVRASVLIIPRSAEVTVFEPAFFIPLIVMHKCSASTTTATPKGFMDSIMTLATSLPSLS